MNQQYNQIKPTHQVRIVTIQPIILPAVPAHIQYRFSRFRWVHASSYQNRRSSFSRICCFPVTKKGLFYKGFNSQLLVIPKRYSFERDALERVLIPIYGYRQILLRETLLKRVLIPIYGYNKGF